MGDPLHSASVISAILPASIVGSLALLWLVRWPRLAFAALAVSLVAGQLIRLPVWGQAGGLLISDIALSCFAVAAALVAVKRRAIPSSVAILLSLVTIFLTWALFTLAITPLPLTSSEILIALAYWLRLASILITLPVTIAVCQSVKFQTAAAIWLKRTILALAVIGIGQFFLVSNLSFLVSRGWDPHMNRLVSTWLDPNFMGAFFVMVIPLLISAGRRWHNLLLLGLVVSAIVLTQSRSTYLSVVALLSLLPLLLITLQRKHMGARLQVAVYASLSLVLTMGVIVLVLFPDRITGLFTQDATVMLRADALQSVWTNIIQPYGVVGVGYNAYQFYAADSGVISSFAIHSRAGADNSFLTIWATTGIIGLTLFLSIGSYVGLMLYTQWRNHPTTQSLIGLGALAVLAVHALFVNSFLYAHLLILLVLLVAISWQSLPSKKLAPAV